MLTLADFGTGQVLWSIFWFALFVLWIALVIGVFSDIVVNQELSGGAKGLWAVFVVVVPYVGVLAYLITHGDRMSHRRPPGSRPGSHAPVRATRYYGMP